jgi:hypothetical protein
MPRAAPGAVSPQIAEISWSGEAGAPEDPQDRPLLGWAELDLVVAAPRAHRPKHLESQLSAHQVTPVPERVLLSGGSTVSGRVVFRR